jgi:polygalacturonase
MKQLGWILAALGAPALHAAVYDVKSFGAVADGKTLDTAAINKAIDSAHAAGGGTVYLPAGAYLADSIHLQSHIALHLDAGASIVATSGRLPTMPPNRMHGGSLRMAAIVTGTTA